MHVKDIIIMTQIERIGVHFRTNISSRFIRPILLQLSLEKEVWTYLEDFTEMHTHYQDQGYSLEELYRQVIFAARFISVTRRELVPNLRFRFNNNPDSPDRILRDMAVNNFASNLKVFAEMISELYANLLKIDKKNTKNRRPLYLSMPELEKVESMLADA